MAQESDAPSTWNIANALTVLRVLLVPVFVWALMVVPPAGATWRWLALAVFLLAMVTDRIDGDLARSRGLVTDFGKIADPIADKALTGTAFVCLSLLGELPWWVTVVVVARELGITALRFGMLRTGVIPASRAGKVKTTLQAVALAMYVVGPGDLLWFVPEVVMGAAVVVTVVTGVDYVVQAFRLNAAARTRKGGAA
ncbi:MAG TPA: CDP-diacylglycerol--glycerol-3-phosphate 3-phosphatidyltransferase [Jiangellaceae bacterium]|nr:CDP-diacylglycerol--glycerol-3-phosphate 3-phosphatidyltransferase [Jiangellaceae bacterium]